MKRRPPSNQRTARKTSDGSPTVQRTVGTSASPAFELVQIEKPIYGGNFLARHEGKAIFVPMALPAERARVRIVDDKSKRGYAVAELEELVEASPQRVAPLCPHFGPCGGCHYQHANYDAQLQIKQDVLRETLSRGGVEYSGEIILLAGEPWGYRNRIRLAFDREGNVGYRGRRSHQIIPIQECPIAAPLLVNAALQAADVLRAFETALQPREIALFCNAEGTQLLVSLFVDRPSKLPLNSYAQTLHDRVPELIGAQLVLESDGHQAPRTLDRWGETSLIYRAAGLDYRVDHGAFFQVNRHLIDRFVQHVTAERKGALAWDLFAGVGLFAKRLAQSFEQVIAVESAPSAKAALAANLQGTGGQAVIAGTLQFLQQNRTGTPPDLIVVDPPRTGLGPEITALLSEIGAANMVYVSCDPATLSRDLRVLVDGAYRIERLALADLFPQTFHLETIAHLRRA